MWNGNFAYYLSKREILLLFAPATEMNSGLGGHRAKRAEHPMHDSKQKPTRGVTRRTSHKIRRRRVSMTAGGSKKSCQITSRQPS